MYDQPTEIRAWQDQLLRVFQRIVYSFHLATAICMILILFLPADQCAEYNIYIFKLLRMTFWIFTVCGSVSLNCAGAVFVLLRIRRFQRYILPPVLLGAMYLSLITSLAVVVALIGEPLPLRAALILSALLLPYVTFLYQLIERSWQAREQREQIARRWW